MADRLSNKVGERHWQNKLSENDVRWIRRNWNPTKMSKTSLAEKYGVQLSTISRIISGESWRHVKATNKYTKEFGFLERKTKFSYNL